MIDFITDITASVIVRSPKIQTKTKCVVRTETSEFIPVEQAATVPLQFYIISGVSCKHINNSTKIVLNKMTKLESYDTDEQTSRA